MAKTYYLTDEMCGNGKKLGKLQGWRKEIAKQLLRKGSSDQDVVISIQEVLETIDTVPKVNLKEAINNIIELLPKNIRGRSRILGYHLIKHVSIDDSGLVRYPDGTEGTSMIDHLKYWCSPPSYRASIPADVDKMQELLTKTNAPEAGHYRKDRSTTTTGTSWIAL